jgi:hypothetical protein
VPGLEGRLPDRYTEVQALQVWANHEFAGLREECFAQMSDIDPAGYNGFLRTLGQAKAGCEQLDEPFAGLLSAWESAAGTTARAEALRKLGDAARGAARETLDCLMARTARVDDRGVLLAGLTWGALRDGDDRLKPVIENPGFALLVYPRQVTAWPGRPESALRVVDPRDGLFRVKSAHTYSPRFERHAFLKEFPKEVTAEFLMNLPSRNTHLLLFDTITDEAVGWIDADQCAFFAAGDEALAKASTFFYTSGAAAFRQGGWYNPQGIKSWDDCENPTVWVRLWVQTDVFYFDFERMFRADVLAPDIMHNRRASSLPFPDRWSWIAISDMEDSAAFRDDGDLDFWVYDLTRTNERSPTPMAIMSESGEVWVHGFGPQYGWRRATLAKIRAHGRVDR